MRIAHTIPELIDVVKTGIRSRYPEGTPKKVLIVGAGLAGLSAAYELKRAGHSPLLLEAQQRVGGRVYTLRGPFTEGLYAEVGAMRIPRAHALTMQYIEKLGLLLSDGGLRQKMGEAARTLAEGFDWDKVAGQWQRALLQLLRPR